MRGNALLVELNTGRPTIENLPTTWLSLGTYNIHIYLFSLQLIKCDAINNSWGIVTWQLPYVFTSALTSDISWRGVRTHFQHRYFLCLVSLLY